MSIRLALVISALLVATASPVQAQSPRPLAAVPPGFESWRPAAPAGVVFCTAVSTLVNESADGGVSFCPLDSYLLIGGAARADDASAGDQRCASRGHRSVPERRLPRRGSLQRGSLRAPLVREGDRLTSCSR